MNRRQLITKAAGLLPFVAAPVAALSLPTPVTWSFTNLDYDRKSRICADFGHVRQAVRFRKPKHKVSPAELENAKDLLLCWYDIKGKFQ